MPSVRFAAMVVFITSRGCPSVVTSNMFNPAPSSKLLNLTGFFSSLPASRWWSWCWGLGVYGRTEAYGRLRCLSVFCWRSVVVEVVRGVKLVGEDRRVSCNAVLEARCLRISQIPRICKLLLQPQLVLVNLQHWSQE